MLLGLKGRAAFLKREALPGVSFGLTSLGGLRDEIHLKAMPKGYYPLSGRGSSCMVETAVDS
jgi:hypothetical protein